MAGAVGGLVSPHEEVAAVTATHRIIAPRRLFPLQVIGLFCLLKLPLVEPRGVKRQTYAQAQIVFLKSLEVSGGCMFPLGRYVEWRIR